MSKIGKKTRINKNEARSYTGSIRTSPIKLNLVAGVIRGLRVQDAINQLTFSKKRVAKIVKTSLNSAIANAENNHDLDIDNLIVSNVNVGKGMVMKRFRARARGRGARILKPFSNLEIIVKELE
jgi:large subunit ribosomal protein L22